jgi:hypothetical protein
MVSFIQALETGALSIVVFELRTAERESAESTELTESKRLFNSEEHESRGVGLRTSSPLALSRCSAANGEGDERFRRFR